MPSCAQTAADVALRAADCTTVDALDAAIVECVACPRLIAWCDEVGAVKRAAYRDEEYWARPVPGFGVEQPRLLIVGLAPGAHGANRTGRMFTGDRSGDWLFRALHRAGFARLPASTSRTDGQQMIGARITATVHCAPPANKPTTEEFTACSGWLRRELELLAPSLRCILALGGASWTRTRAALRSTSWQVPSLAFGHGAGTIATRAGQSMLLLGSYHPSQQNTFTGRLTEAMLDDVLARAAHACA